MTKTIFKLFLLLLLKTSLYAQDAKEGGWRGEIHYQPTDENLTVIPFTFTVSYPENSTAPVLSFINGQDSASINATVQNDTLMVPMFGFDITLKMAVNDYDNDIMNGYLIKHYNDRKYAFKAVYGAPRYSIEKEEDVIEVGSRWNMKVNVGRPDEYSAVGLFEQQGNKVTGTIMTEVSDYRFFEGKVEGNEIELSTFDGVHSFLLKGSYDEMNQQWSGDLILDEGYSRPWVAEQDDKAELPDPFEIVDLSGKDIKPDLKKLAALTDQQIDPSDYEGKMLIIQLMGTWCSNSQDQTRYLRDWIATNPDRDVKFLAVNYEANYSPQYGLKRIETYKNRLNVPYDMILGGPLSKTKAAEAFPFMEEIMAFPTLVFIDKDGYARYVHSYFTGPATGEYYKDFDQRFNAIVDKLTQ